MAMKIILRILFNFVLILKAFEMTVNGGAVPISLPNFDCVEYAQKIGANWRTLNLPHKTDCTKFYQCSDHGLFEMTCADAKETRFNPWSNRCDWNSTIECVTFDQFMELSSTNSCD